MLFPCFEDLFKKIRSFFNCLWSHQVRNVFAQLARAEEEVAKLTMVHESAQTEWKSRKEFLEKELNEAVTHKVDNVLHIGKQSLFKSCSVSYVLSGINLCSVNFFGGVLFVQESLSEQVQILQGKISVLEDELQKAQSQEKGEVLGPIMEVRCSV